MSSYASTSIPKPKNWQDFQIHTCTLFKCILNDPNATTHGSEGQRQQGVDVYGSRDGQGEHWVGVQCKLKGDNKKVTEAELKTEVAEAKKFKPALADFVLVTTAPDDVKIQQVARQITKQHKEEGLFTVSVWGWQTLEREIANHPAGMEAFHPDMTPFSNRQIALSEQAVAISLGSKEELTAIRNLLERHLFAGSSEALGADAADRSSAADEAIERIIHNEIDGYRDLLRNGRARTARELLQGLKARVWDTASARVRFRIVTNIGAAYLELGEEQRAASDFLEAIDYDPEDRIGMRLRWAGLCIRLNQQGRVEGFLEGDVEALSGTPELKMELAHWLDRFDSPERALKLGYSVFLEHSALPQVHLRYISLLLRPSRSDSVPLQVESINDDFAFEIDDGRGGKSWFVIEPDAGLRKDETYVAPDEEIARKAKGLRVGGTIHWDGHRTDWTVVSLKHKYIHALHLSMEKFERHFPTEQGLRRVSIDLATDEPFEEVFKDVKGRHDSIQRVFDVLDEGLIPIHVAAGALGMNIIETRYGLQEAGRTYRVCAGTHPERADAITAVRSNERRGCVLDALTLNLVRRLGIEKAVQEVCGPIGVTGSTRDVFWHRLHDMKEGGGPTPSLFWKDGYYYRHEPTQADWDHALQVREADLAWIDENATILPAEGSADPPEGLRRLDQAIGHNFIDDMLAAQGSGRLLLCQDQAYRALAAQSLGVKSSWLQPVLMAARDEGALSRDEYDKAITALIDFGDQGISIDSGVLLAAACEDEGVPQGFDRIVTLLGGPQAEMLSHIGVAVDFLGHIWSERPNELATAKQTGLVLENLLKGQTEWRGVIAVLRRVFLQRAGREERLDNYILGWLQGHFLVPFGTRSLPLAEFAQES